MPIRQDPKTKRWYYRFSRRGKDGFQGGFRTADQAREAERVAYDVRVNREIHPELFCEDLTFQDGSKLFFENHCKRHNKAWEISQKRLEVLSSYLANRSVREITSEELEGVLEELKQERAIKDHTWNHYLALVKCMYNWLRKTKRYRGDNPAVGVPMRRVERARVRFLYPAEERILTPALAADPILWAVYVAGLHTGLRLGELLRLQVKDVSLAARTMFVSRSKTGRSRYVPVSEALAQFLAPRIEGKTHEDRVMPAVTRGYVSHRFRRMATKAGVCDLRFHDLRHTFAERLLSKGVPIYKVSKLLGHSSVVTTETHYGHLSMQDLKSAVDRIDGTVSGLEGGETVAVELQWKRREYAVG